MNAVVLAAMTVAIAFFVGAIPFGVLVSRWFYGYDIRRSGSGNIGAANALRTLGKRGAVAVLVFDALKGFIPTLVANRLFGSEIAILTGLACVIGHCWSPFLQFKGGKGVATFLGTVVALWWWAGIAFAIVWAAAAMAWGYASVASIAATTAMAPVLWFGIGRAGLAYGILCAALILYRHRENVDRLRKGTENRLSLLKARSQ